MKTPPRRVVGGSAGVEWEIRNTNEEEEKTIMKTWVRHI